MNQGILVLVDIALWLALAGALRYAMYPLRVPDGHDSSRAALPRRPGTARPAPPFAVPVAGLIPPIPPMGPAGTAAAPRHAAAVPSRNGVRRGTQPRHLPLPVETPALYNTGAQPRLSEQAEGWWLL